MRADALVLSIFSSTMKALYSPGSILGRHE